MGHRMRVVLVLLMIPILVRIASAAGARTNAHDTFNVRNHYSHTTLKDFVPSNPSPTPSLPPSHNPSPQPNCDSGNNGGNWGGGNWGNWNWGNWSSGSWWGTGNWNGGAWGNSGNWGGGHVHNQRCYWVNGGYQWQTQYVWIPDHWERQWTPPLYRYDVYEGLVYPVLVRDGYYADVYINGYYETRRVSAWVDGYWVCF